MPISVSEQLPPACRWTSRLAVFSLVVFVTAAILHRLGLPTLAAFNMLLMAYSGAAVAFVLAIIGTVSIWRHGKPLLDLHGGFRDTGRGTPWTRETLVLFWSATKGLAYSPRARDA